MATEMIKIDNVSASIIDAAKNYLSMKNLTKNEITQFIEICTAYQLNPFKREIYVVAFNSKDGGRQFSIFTGYEVYLKRAERTGKLNGWVCEVDDKFTRATCTIYRKDWERPFVHSVSMKEYNSGMSLWKSKPETMLKKVAISQAFRLAFPDELGGMPYDASEVQEYNYEDIPKEPVVFDTPKSTFENPVIDEEDVVNAMLEKIVDVESANNFVAELQKMQLSEANMYYANTEFRNIRKSLGLVLDTNMKVHKKADSILENEVATNPIDSKIAQRIEQRNSENNNQNNNQSRSLL